MVTIQKQTCFFLHLLEGLSEKEDYYMLSVWEYDKVKPNRTLVGYYDNNYIYFIPNVIFGLFDSYCLKYSLPPLNYQGILEQLALFGAIKVEFGKRGTVSYRIRKRLGKTRKRYITVIRGNVR